MALQNLGIWVIQSVDFEQSAKTQRHKIDICRFLLSCLGIEIFF